MARPADPQLDEMDLRILEHLEVDGRTSFSDIAANLGVTLSTISNRVRRLTEDGILVIHGFLDPYQVGFNAPALILVSVNPSRVEESAEEIAKFPEVLSLLMITGDFDLAVEVQCRDSNHLTDLLLNKLQRVEGVRETRTSIQLREIRIKQPSVKMLIPQSA